MKPKAVLLAIVLCLIFGILLIAPGSQTTFPIKISVQFADSEATSAKPLHVQTLEEKRHVRTLEPPANHVVYESQAAPTNFETTQMSASDSQKLWSFEVLHEEFTQKVESNVRMWKKERHDMKQRSLLFIDGREQCHRVRGFLNDVRQSGFEGYIVFMVYYTEDLEKCQHLTSDFSPLELFYVQPVFTPLYEGTMLQYYGIDRYFEQFPAALEAFSKAAVVKPEEVFWCNSVNPFDSVPTPGTVSELYKSVSITNYTIFGVISIQTDVVDERIDPTNRADPKQCTVESGTRERVLTANHNFKHYPKLIDHFVASTPVGLRSFVQEIIKQREAIVNDAISQNIVGAPQSSFKVIGNSKTRPYIEKHVVQLQPQKRFEAGDCFSYFPETISDCLSCQSHTLTVGMIRCAKKITDPTPNYTPFCKIPYRSAIMEVPSNTSLRGIANAHVTEAAARLRNIFHGNKSAVGGWRGKSKECPYGLLAVVAMMAKYDLNRVKNFIGSLMLNGDPNCVRLVMFISANMNVESAVKAFPGRVEAVRIHNCNGAECDTDYFPQSLSHCTPSDSRYEVMQRWLEKNHHRFHFVLSVDSRDYMWMADPYKQLVKVVAEYEKNNGRDINEGQPIEFVASVAENFAAGGASHPQFSASGFLRRWLSSCGHNCFRGIGKMKFTNGEPVAILNSGHIIGTSVGLLDYYRFHIQMMRESGHNCDGTDQGLFTYYMYGMLQEAHYPHKVLVFSSSYSGFANLPPPHRMSRRLKGPNLPKDSPDSYEYTVLDCSGNIIAGLHQYDRLSFNNDLLVRELGFRLNPLIENGAFKPANK